MYELNGRELLGERYGTCTGRSKTWSVNTLLCIIAWSVDYLLQFHFHRVIVEHARGSSSGYGNRYGGGGGGGGGGGRYGGGGGGGGGRYRG